MKNNQPKTKSVLVMAGSRSLSSSLPYPPSMDTKKLMIKLTLPRLRKMQALVRGFLVRRRVYPSLLKEYLLAKSILHLLISNVMYKQCSQVIMEQLTYLKYQPVEAIQGLQNKFEIQIANKIISNVIRGELTHIMEGAVVEQGKLITRPKITYGFNLRDPLELLLFDTVNAVLRRNLEEVVDESITQAAQETRIFLLFDEWIQEHRMLQPLYEQIVQETLKESIAEYVVDHMLEKAASEGGQVVSQLVYNQQMEAEKEESSREIENNMIQWLLQESVMQALLELKHK